MMIPSPLFSLDNLYRAYRQCRRRKRSTHNAMDFESDPRGNLVRTLILGFVLRERL